MTPAMRKTRRQVLRFATAGTAAALAHMSRGDVAASEDYPSKPIKLIVPAAPGGPTDAPGRLASQILAAKLGQPVVVENRPGAGGAIGARVVASAPADGYTLLVGNTSTLAVIPAVSTSAGYDPVKDFVPIVKLTEGIPDTGGSPVFTMEDGRGICRGQQSKPNQDQDTRIRAPVEFPISLASCPCCEAVLD